MASRSIEQIRRWGDKSLVLSLSEAGGSKIYFSRTGNWHGKQELRQGTLTYIVSSRK
ncbi:MAG: hypothetical protein ACOX0N_05390 [Syntrophomonadaceae bacterium]|nr:hypothetical protein [Syntrophomonadaceae bacterium]